MKNKSPKELAETYVKSSFHRNDPYCEPGYYHPMRKGFIAGYAAAEARAEVLKEAIENYCYEATGSELDEAKKGLCREALKAYEQKESE